MVEKKPSMTAVLIFIVLSAPILFLQGWTGRLVDREPVIPPEEGDPLSAASGPTLVWNTFLGGGGNTESHDIALDAAGNVYLAGYSDQSFGSPVRPFEGAREAFVAKFSPEGVLLWNTFLGGSGDDSAYGIGLDNEGNIAIAGYSSAAWGTPVHDHAGGSSDAFAARLNSQGTLVWNTFLGGSGYDAAFDLVVDSAGRLSLSGDSSAGWGNPRRPFQSGSYDAFAARLDANGDLLWNTFLGGEGWDHGTCLGVGGDGCVLVGGESCLCNAFLAKLDSDGELIWNTFFDNRGYGEWEIRAVALFIDELGTVTVALEKNGGFSTLSYLNSVLRRWTSGGDLLSWAIDLSNDPPWSAADLAIDGAGIVYVVGTRSIYANMGPDYDHSCSLRRFSPQGNEVRFEAGESGEDFGRGLALDGKGSVFIAGYGSGSWGSPIQQFPGGTAAFVAKLYEPPLTVASPDGGESWFGGSTEPVTWRRVGSIPNVCLEYSVDGGAAWTMIVDSTPNTGSYPWNLPAIVSAQCLVRVSEAGTGAYADTSDAAFSITDIPPAIGLSRTSFNFGTEQNATPTTPGQVRIANTGTGTLHWTAAASADWILVQPAAWTGNGVLTVGLARTDLVPGFYQGTVMISDPIASNSPQFIQVGCTVLGPGEDGPPFGNFATPDEGATVSSSIPVTGWALDDIEMQAVRIYRGTGLADRVYIGDATFVPGARPDVEAAFPTYPNNDRAGWGYMLLTNMLPNGGNGTFTLLAYAADLQGHETLLGSKTVLCDNLNAVKPFGAIDTPAQGGAAAGSFFNNFGWALTPPPNIIPEDGSTLLVWVDGLPLGHPVYNHYRADIAALFPGYANANGAVGYFGLDTTGYSDGLHTIAWSAVDSAGNVDGIGSRYFWILNSFVGVPGTVLHQDGMSRSAGGLPRIPDEGRSPILVKQGYGDPFSAETLFPDQDGVYRIRIPEIGRIVLDLDGEGGGEAWNSEAAFSRRPAVLADHWAGTPSYEAYELVLGELRPLPVGSSFNPESGAFAWQPGPGFIGEYQIVFLKSGPAGKIKKIVTISVGMEVKGATQKTE